MTLTELEWAFSLRAAVSHKLCQNTLYLKKPDPETFCYNFAKIALIEIKIGTHNLHMM